VRWLVLVMFAGHAWAEPPSWAWPGCQKSAAPTVTDRPHVFRQLYGFQSGSRHGGTAVLMQPVVAGLTERDLVDLAAYVASLDP
jgi:cytochrome c553